MHTVQIPPGRWREFLRDFERAHHGAIVTVNIQRPNSGPAAEVPLRPLSSIGGDADEVTIRLGDAVRAPLCHTMPHVAAIAVEQTDEGADAALEIAGEDGTHTRLRLRWPMHADVLDPAVE